MLVSENQNMRFCLNQFKATHEEIYKLNERYAKIVEELYALVGLDGNEESPPQVKKHYKNLIDLDFQLKVKEKSLNDLRLRLSIIYDIFKR